MPTLVQTYVVNPTAGSTNRPTMTTASFTPVANELLVVKVSASASDVTCGTPTGGGLTWTLRASQTGTANSANGYLWTARVGSNPSAMTVSVARTDSTTASRATVLVVERWSNAALATTPATNATKLGTAGTAPSATVTSTAVNSVITWFDTDYTASNTATAAYRTTSATPTQNNAVRITTNNVIQHWSAWQPVTTVAAQTIGMSAPTQRWTMLGIEILDDQNPVYRTRFQTGFQEGMESGTDSYQSATPTAVTGVPRFTTGTAQQITLGANNAQNPNAGASAGTTFQRSESYANPYAYNAPGFDSSNLIGPGFTGYFGFSIGFDKSFPVDPNSWQIITQWKNNGSGSPPLELIVDEGMLALDGNNGSWKYNLCPIVPGNEYNIIIQPTFTESASTSNLNVWVNGVQVLTNQKPVGAGLLYSGVKSYLKVGMYRNASVIPEAATIWYGAVCFDTDYNKVNNYLLATTVDPDPLTPLAPAFASLKDEFSTGTLDTTDKWANTYNPANNTPCAVVNGRARVYADPGPNYASIQSKDAWRLADSAVMVQVPVVAKVTNGASTGTVQTAMIVQSAATANATPGTRLSIAQRSDLNKIQFRVETNYGDANAVQIDYDPVAHRWWRMRHDGANLYWETSPDSNVWTIQRTATAPTWITNVDQRVVLESWRDNGPGDYAEFDSFNTYNDTINATSTNYDGASQMAATAAISTPFPSRNQQSSEQFDNAVATLTAIANQTLGMQIAMNGGPATYAGQPFVTVRGVGSTMPATAAMSSQPALVGAAALAATASASFNGYAVRPLSVQLTATAQLNADATVLPALYVLMYSSGNMELNPRTVMQATSGMSATALASFEAYKQTWGQSTLPATASLAANAVLRQVAAASLSAPASLSVATPAVNNRLAISMTAPASLFASLGPATYQMSYTFAAYTSMSTPSTRGNLAASVNLNAPASLLNPDVFFIETTANANSDMSVAPVKQGHALAAVLGATARMTSAAQRVQVIANNALTQDDSLSSYLVADGRVAVLGGITISATARIQTDPYVYTPVIAPPKGERVIQSPLPVLRLYMFDTMTGRVAFELPYSSLSWSSKLNSYGDMSATLVVESVLDKMYAQGAANPRKAFREFLTGPYRFSLGVVYGSAVLFAGPFLPSSDPADSPTVDIKAVEIHKIFENRILINPGSGTVSDPSRDVIFKAATKRGHIYRVVEHATNGLGRKLPIICSDPPLLRGDQIVKYNSYDLVTAAKALEELVTSDGGPDLRFDPFLIEGDDGLYINWDMKIGDPYLDGPLYTWDDANATISRDTDAVSLATWVYSPGSGQDRGKAVGQSHSDYLTMLGFPVLEKVQGDNTSEVDLRSLDSFAAAAVRAGQEPTQKWSLKVPRDGLQAVGSYRVGDPIRLDIRKHLTIDPGTYDKRITEIAGDDSDLVTLTVEDDVVESNEYPVIIGAAAPPVTSSRWASGNVFEGMLNKPENFNSAVPTVDPENSVYRANSLHISLLGDGVQQPGPGASARSGDQRVILEPATPGRQGTGGSFGEGSRGAFGISFVLGENFPVNTNSWQVIAQLKDDAPYNYSAPFEVRIGNGMLAVGGWNGAFYREIAPVEAGERYDVVVEIYFSAYVNRNWYSVWVNGVQYVFQAQTGPDTATIYYGYRSYFQIGLYRDAAIIEPASIDFGAVAYDSDVRAVLAYMQET